MTRADQLWLAASVMLTGLAAELMLIPALPGIVERISQW